MTISFKRSQMKQTSTLLQRFNSILFLFLLTISLHNAKAQCTGTTCGSNLVPNPGFELTTTYCGSGDGELYTDISPVQDWFGTRSSTSTNSQDLVGADYYNVNCPSSDNGPRCNASDGDGSVAIYIKHLGSSARESIQAKLKAPLKKGHMYCISMKVFTTWSGVETDGLGAWVHNKGKIDVNTMNGGSSFLGAGTLLNAKPQVENDPGVMFTNNCRIFSKTFCADGGEDWIMISNFRKDADTYLNKFPGIIRIDNVSLQEVNCLTISSITASADSVCPGSCADLTANATGGNGTYTYLWSTGETTKKITVCPTVTGTKYTCIVNSSVGCAAFVQATDSVTIHFKAFIPAPTITVTGTPTMCTGDSVILTSSTAPSYKWNTNQTTKSIVVKTSGIYTVTVKHPVSGCNTASASVSVVVNTLPVLNLSGLINTSSSCDVKDGSLKGVVATGTPGFSYYWNSTPVQTTPDLVNVGPGVYTLTVTDGNGCKKSTTGTITNKPAPNPPTLQAASPAICVGTNTTLFVTGADPSYTYSWTDPSSNVISSSDIVYINNAQLKDGGVYKVTATKYGCTGASASLTLTVNPLPVIDTTTWISHQTSCGLKDGSITGIKVTGAPTLKYAWDGGPQTTTTPDLTGAGIGTHTLVVTDGKGCVQSTTGKVWNKYTPDSATVKSTSAVICEGLPTTLYVSPSDPTITYKWITPSKDTIINDSIILSNSKVKDAGTYTVTATKANCTSLESHSILIVNPAAISQKVTITKNIICEGDSTIIDAALHMPGITYNIYTQSSGGAPIGAAPLKVYPKVTTTYYMEATTGSNCRQLTARDTVTIIVNPAPVVQPPVASNAIICEGKSTTIDVLNPVAGITYNVYSASTGGALLGQTPFTTSLVKTTTFYIEAQTIKGCVQTTGRIPITITVNPTPIGPKIWVQGTNNNPNHICDGLSAILTSSIPTGISWSTGATTASITVTKAGVYTVYYTDSHGCASLKDSVDIKINTPPKVDVSNYIVDTVRCNATIGGIHGIVINSGTAPYTYNWYEAGDPTKTVSTDLILQGVGSGKYTLVVTDNNGCKDQLSNVFIPTKGGIVAHLSSNPTTGFLPLDIVVTTGISGTGVPIDYVWSLNGHVLGTTDGKTNTYSIKGLPYGEHVIQVNVRDMNGCKSVDYLTIFVNTKIHFNDVNIFTPNGDGTNDILIFPTEGVKAMTGKIYDRWGLKLFEWSDMTTGWDGNTDSGPAPDGTYYYIINYTDVYDAPAHSASGFIELLRK